MLSHRIITECCGTTCDKSDLASKVAELEKQLTEERQISEELRGRLRGGMTREEFGRKCFEAGYYVFGDAGCERHWLQFKAEEGL